MTQTNRFFIVAGTLGIVAISLFIFDATEGAEGPKSVFVHPIGLEGGVLRNEEHSMTPLLRQAKRLASRLESRIGYIPPLPELANALLRRQELLKRSLTVTFEDIGYGTSLKDPWSVSLQHYPHWISFRTSQGVANFVVDPYRIQTSIAREGYPQELVPPTHSILLSAAEDDAIVRAQSTEVAQPGYTFVDLGDSSSRIATALTTGEATVMLPVARKNGQVFYATQEGFKTLDLLASGHSNFAGSPLGRSRNIVKAINEHLNNIIVKPDETFSFNSTLGGPVSLRNGWAEALGIFNGGDLRPVPGGGICQTSTTMYRAILQAGLPVLERKSHSLYVGYYEKYGVGLDATIFQGGQDLVFQNNTPSYLLIQGYTEGNDVYINIYGTHDGRSVVLEGPYFATNTPDDFSEMHGRSLRSTEIGWIQHITHADGTSEGHTIVSRYKILPSSVVAKFQNMTPNVQQSLL